MSEKLVVDSDLMPDWLEKYDGIMSEINKQLIRGIRDQGKGLTLEHLQAMVEHRNPFSAVVVSPVDDLTSRTAKLLSEKFGKRIIVDPLPPEFTKENLARWARFNRKPIFLPDEEISEDRELKKWIKPESWFYQKVREGRIRSDAAQLYKGWYLADCTPGVNYTNGSQVFPNDPLAPIITKLREERKIGRHDNTPLGSRFSITNDEWRDVVCPAVAEEWGFKPEQVHLERAAGFNAIGNLYDSSRGRFDMWEWFADSFGDSDRLGGGHRWCGGLANVYCYWSDSRLGYIAGRPLVSFVR